MSTINNQFCEFCKFYLTASERCGNPNSIFYTQPRIYTNSCDNYQKRNKNII